MARDALRSNRYALVAILFLFREYINAKPDDRRIM